MGSLTLTRRAKTIVNAMSNAFAHEDIAYAVSAGLQLETYDNTNMTASGAASACQMDGLWIPTARECKAADRIPLEETSEQEDEIVAAGGDPDADIEEQESKMPVVLSGEPDIEIAPA